MRETRASVTETPTSCTGGEIEMDTLSLLEVIVPCPSVWTELSSRSGYHRRSMIDSDKQFRIKVV